MTKKQLAAHRKKKQLESQRNRVEPGLKDSLTGRTTQREEDFTKYLDNDDLDLGSINEDE